MARFLVVEDYPPLATAIRLAIAREGHDVVKCHSFQAALELGESFDYAVLDVDLADGNGVDLATQLFAEVRVTSVVFFTASRDRKLLEKAASKGLVVDKAAGCQHLMRAVNQLTQIGEGRRAAVVGAPGGVAADSGNRSGTRRKVDRG